jgi:hypothetical protein
MEPITTLVGVIQYLLYCVADGDALNDYLTWMPHALAVIMHTVGVQLVKGLGR